MRFTIDYLTTGLLLCGLLIIFLLKRFLMIPQPPPSLAFSRLKDLNIPSQRSRLIPSLTHLHLAALACFMIAFIDPHFLFPRSLTTPKPPLNQVPTEGLAIYLVLDQSGSMAQSVVATGENGRLESIPKIDLLKRVTKQFIIDHPSDLIGLISFARIPRVLVPLTLDQGVLLKHLDHLQVVKHPEEDGTAIGYAIFKTANLMAATRYFAQDLREGRPPYTIKSAVMIVVTDGFQNPSRLDQGNRLRTMELDDAAKYAKSQNIHLYVINIDPSFSSSKYAPHRRQFDAITQLTGGRFYLVSDTQGLAEIYADIDRLERGTIFQEAKWQPKLDEKSAYSRFSLYPFFIFLGLAFLGSALFLDFFLLKQVP